MLIFSKAKLNDRYGFGNSYRTQGDFCDHLEAPRSCSNNLDNPEATLLRQWLSEKNFHKNVLHRFSLFLFSFCFETNGTVFESRE